MTSSVTAPLERQFGQMPGLKQMSSTSSGGASVITLQFSLELSLDVAEQEVQAAINAARQLPADRPADAADLQQGQSGRRADPHARAHVEDAAAAEGAGSRRHAPRAEDLAAPRRRPRQHLGRPAPRRARPGEPDARSRRYGLALDDVRTAIANANVNQAKGSFDGPTRASTIDANDQLSSADEYRSLIIAYKNGAPIRLSDVADVIDGAENMQLAAWANDDAGDHPEHPAPAGRQRDRGRRPRSRRCCRSCRRRCRRGRRARC